jgi:hypothetical protein
VKRQQVPFLGDKAMAPPPPPDRRRKRAPYLGEERLKSRLTTKAARIPPRAAPIGGHRSPSPFALYLSPVCLTQFPGLGIIC